MIIFYATKIDNDIAILAEDEARHCSKVLRKRVGDSVDFTDGKGCFYNGKIIEISKNRCRIAIDKKIKGNQLPYDLTIAISPVKNPARFEWFVEKAVEIGIGTIVPLMCKRTEKRNIKTARIENIIISAAKQSLKAEFPVLKQPVKYDEFIKNVNPAHTFIAHLNDDAFYLGKIGKTNNKIVVIIGPEGDFTDEELSEALGLGIKTVTLGTSRLRTETAGVVACQIINSIYEMEK